MNLNPWYVTGLVEGEGCFSVDFSLRSRLKVGIETKPSFSVTLKEGDLELLKALWKYFRCGSIRYSRSDRTYKFEVRNVRDLVRKVIPHFQRYPLQGLKRRDYQLFVEIVQLVHRNHHLNPKYLREIIELAYQMNPSGKRKYGKEELLRVLGEVKG